MCLFKKSSLPLLLATSSFLVTQCSGMTKIARAKGFVYLDEVDPTILASLRLITNKNFVGTPVDGYKQARVIMTKQAAQALKHVQADVKKDGYCLVVYDAYRPQQAVDHFVRWSNNADESTKAQYYPSVDKNKLFKLGYIAKRSSHTRGSTVDLTLIEDGKVPHEIEESDRRLLDGSTIKFLDDGTVDMGSSLDLCGPASHLVNNLVEEKHTALRTYLKNVMKKHGFRGYTKEWWHFTLKNEPYPKSQDSSYFDFPIE